MDWYKAFKDQNKQDWLNKIQRDNPNTNPTEAHHSVYPNINGLSYATIEDLPSNRIETAQGNIYWKTGIIISENDLYKLKSNLEIALMNGAELICIKDFIPTSEVIWSELIQNIQTDIVELHLEIKSPEDFNKILNFDLENIKLQCLFEIDQIKNSELLSTYQSVELLTSDIHDVKVKLNQLKNKKFKSAITIIEVLFHDDFLTNLSCFRSIRQFLSTHQIDCNLRIGLDPKVITKDSNYNMIRFGTIGLAAAISEPDAILFPPYDVLCAEKNEASIRNVLHLQQIYKMESHLDWVNDPLSGSYYLENLSEKINNYLNSVDEN